MEKATGITLFMVNILINIFNIKILGTPQSHCIIRALMKQLKDTNLAERILF